MDKNGAITKKLWPDIYQKSKEGHCGIPPLKFNGHVYNDSLGKAKVLNDYFTSLFTPISSSAPPPMDGPHFPDITFQIFGTVEFLAERSMLVGEI